MAQETSRFTASDYVVFSLSLLVSSAVGFYYACTGGKQRTVTEFLYGNRKLKIFPVAMSLMATGTSALGLLGVTSETYLYGAQFSLETFSIFIVAPITAFIFLPLFYQLHLTSTYQYLELRYNRWIRRLGTFMYLIQTLGFISPCLYAPSSALSQVTGLKLWAIMLITDAVCILYTVIGGIKAVVLVDTIQQMLVFIGMITVVIVGYINAGGFIEVWTSSSSGGRTNFFDFNPDPRYMYTFWTVVVGGTFSWLPFYTCDQSMVQRYLAMPSMKAAQIAILLTILLYVLIKFLYLLIGFLLYHAYAMCDPYLVHKITKYDQILPYFVVDRLNYLSGIGGLFVAAIYSSSLSAISSGLNASAIVILEDILKPMLDHFWKYEISEIRGAWVSKIIVLFVGGLSLGIAFILSYYDRTLFQIMMSLYGIPSGPFLGLFMLGIFFKKTNSEGVFFGVVAGFIVIIWVAFGNFVTGPSLSPDLPFHTEGCDNETLLNASLMPWRNTTRISVDDIHGLDNLYRLSFMYYSMIGWLITVIVGLLASYVFDKIRPGRSPANPKYIVPLKEMIISLLPERCKRQWRGQEDTTDGDELERLPLDNQIKHSASTTEKEQAENNDELERISLNNQIKHSTSTDREKILSLTNHVPENNDS